MPDESSELTINLLETNIMHDLTKLVFRGFVILAAFSLCISVVQQGLAEETSATSKVTFHVA